MQPDLFSPLALGDLHLPNRILMAPLTRSRATPERVPTPMMTEHYVQRAGAGLLISEATNVVALSNAWECTPGIYTPEQIEAWRGLVAAVHAAGGRIALQLWHGGRVAAQREPGAPMPVSPSGVNDDLERITVWGRGEDGKFMKLVASPSRAMTTAEVRETVAAFGAAARAAREVGFDAVQLHAANGYLPHQFLSEHLNRREDAYGGTPAKRARFAIEVVEAMAAHFPPGRVGLRISPFAPFNGAVDPDPVPAYTTLLTEAVRAGLGWLELADSNFWSGRFDRDAMLALARPVFGGPIIANGGIDPEQGQALVREGCCEAVSFGRLWITNPDLVERMRLGGPYTIKPLTRRFYGGGADGYNDYPTLAQERAAQGA